MYRIAVAGLLSLFLVAGCGRTDPSTSTSTATSGATPASNSTAGTLTSADHANAPEVESAPLSKPETKAEIKTEPTTANRVSAAQKPNAVVKPTQSAAAAVVATNEEPATVTDSTKPVVPEAPTSSATNPSDHQDEVAAAPVKPQAPTLDLTSLQQRLRDTHAIGIMTKLSLKNQVDDLLDEFKAFYAGKGKTPLQALRQRYDLLVIKVLSLLQDKDAMLAESISSSREAIWDILADPKKFAQIS